jgi:hypothetical protein
VVIADPCKQVRCRSRAALTGWYQDGALALLDEAACHMGSSREELALALVDKRQTRAYENKHGVDPRSPCDLPEAANLRIPASSVADRRSLVRSLRPWTARFSH